MYLPHDLLVAKSEAYGIDNNGLNLIRNYLTNRKQRTKISSSYFSIYLLMISFFLLKKQIYAISLMVVQYIAIISICKLF